MAGNREAYVFERLGSLEFENLLHARLLAADLLAMKTGLLVEQVAKVCAQAGVEYLDYAIRMLQSGLLSTLAAGRLLPVEIWRTNDRFSKADVQCPVDQRLLSTQTGRTLPHGRYYTLIVVANAVTFQGGFILRTFRLFLLVSTVLIYLFTYTAVASHGVNWPAVALVDLTAMDWRTQFDVDFIIHLLILALWVSWREGFTARGHCFGVLSIVLGGMFSFPYLIHASLISRGDIERLLIGTRKSG